MAKNKTTVTIGHQEYTLVGEESKEHIHRVARYVDSRMKEIITGAISANDTMLAMLTAVNIADVYVKLLDETVALKKELGKAQEEIAQLRRANKNTKPLQVVSNNKPAARQQENRKNSRL